MNETKTHSEFIYRPETTAKMTAARVLLITMYTVFCAIYLILFWATLRSIAMLILLPFIMFAMIRMTWRLVNTEYEVAVEAGELTVSVIYGKAGRRLRFSRDIREMSLMAPYDSSHAQLFKEHDITEVKTFGTRLDGDGAFACVCPEVKKNEKTVIVFRCDDDVKRLLRLANPSAMRA